jgi:hypothetical protein
MFRLSLRELMVIVACVALAIVSLKYASDGWLAVIAGVTMAALFVAIIVAAVDRGPRQAFAIGFALTMSVYWMIVLNGATSTSGFPSRNLEFDQWAGKLPTTRLLRYVHRVLEHGGYYDSSTGKEISDYDPAKDLNRTTGGGGFAGASGGGGRVSYRERPPREFFMPIGHCWWGLLLAYCGGHFARYVYGRRVMEQASA